MGKKDKEERKGREGKIESENRGYVLKRAHFPPKRFQITITQTDVYNGVKCLTPLYEYKRKYLTLSNRTPKGFLVKEGLHCFVLGSSWCTFSHLYLRLLGRKRSWRRQRKTGPCCACLSSFFLFFPAFFSWGERKIYPVKRKSFGVGLDRSANMWVPHNEHVGGGGATVYLSFLSRPLPFFS